MSHVLSNNHVNKSITPNPLDTPNPPLLTNYASNFQIICLALIAAVSAEARDKRGAVWPGALGHGGYGHGGYGHGLGGYGAHGVALAGPVLGPAHLAGPHAGPSALAGPVIGPSHLSGAVAGPVHVSGAVAGPAVVSASVAGPAAVIGHHGGVWGGHEGYGECFYYVHLGSVSVRN